MNQSYEELIAKRRAVNQTHIDNGVFIMDPENTYISEAAKIGKGTVIYPNNHIEGETRIGENCEIGPNNRITNMILGDAVNIQYSVAVDSEIGRATSVGPYAYIRPGSKIGAGSRIGDFVEIKNAAVGDGTKIPHLTYIGDSDVGGGVNIGCGSVTVNYDGKRKFRTTIEDGAFIGCNTNLVAPVTVKKGGYTAAGSTVTADVPENALAVGRARQKNIENWIRPYER
ncbi:MAG: hypothetical protein LBU77_01980 [Clostridiales bacterium]|jgi:bifunctional UDP-N-acetylglucosamine pyrophosphorylase/glucosamine-1-phosphate N-acetyltransferase|nr:hypothetical protein [Clostridiales bacterium]